MLSPVSAPASMLALGGAEAGGAASMNSSAGPNLHSELQLKLKRKLRRRSEARGGQQVLETPNSDVNIRLGGVCKFNLPVRV